MNFSVETPNSSFCTSWGIRPGLKAINILYFCLKTGDILRYRTENTRLQQQTLSRLMNPDASVGALYNSLVKNHSKWFRVTADGARMQYTIVVGAQAATIPASKRPRTVIQRKVNTLIDTIREVYETAIVHALETGDYDVLTRVTDEFVQYRRDQKKAGLR